MIFTTGTFGAGKERYYTRKKFAEGTADADIIKYFQAIATLSAGGLLAVSKTLFYGDPMLMPDVDDNMRYRVRFQVSESDVGVTEIYEIPLSSTRQPDVATLIETKGADMPMADGNIPDEAFIVTDRPERNARG